MEIFCPLCKRRISNWQDASGKCEVVEGVLVHKSCIMDFWLKYGKGAFALLKLRIRGEA